MLSLDQLKESYQLLNEELSKQQVVNESLMNSIIEKCRNSIEKESNWILNWSIVDMFISAIIGVVSLCIILFHSFIGDGLSFWHNLLVWTLLLFAIGAFFVDRHSVKILTEMARVDLPVQEIAALVIRYKRWVYSVFGVMSVVLLVFFATYYFYQSTEGSWKDMPLSAQVIGGAVGSSFGFVAAFLMIRWINFKPLKKIQDSCKELSDAENISETPDKES